MLTKFSKFVKENVHWFVFGLCVFVLVTNLVRLGGGPEHKGPRGGQGQHKAVEGK
jgi:hypothetical protein